LMSKPWRETEMKLTMKAKAPLSKQKKLMKRILFKKLKMTTVLN